MSNNLEKIRNFIGEERLNRAIEVMGILGLSLPEEFDIYWKYWDDLSLVSHQDELSESSQYSYCVVLSGDRNLDQYTKQEVLDKLGYFEFTPRHTTVCKIIDGVFYEWENTADIHESLHIVPGKRHSSEKELHLCFNKRDEGTNTSDMYMDGVHRFPYLSSDIHSVRIYDRTIDINETAPLDQYFNLFQKLLTSPRFEFLVPASLRQEGIYSTILKIYKRPICEYVASIKTEDQSWRYDKEVKRVKYRCESEKEDAKKKFDKAVAEARRYYEYEVERAEDKKNARLAEVATEAEQYKAERGTISH